jgi:hypothetical protein
LLVVVAEKVIGVENVVEMLMLVIQSAWSEIGSRMVVTYSPGLASCDPSRGFFRVGRHDTAHNQRSHKTVLSVKG